MSQLSFSSPTSSADLPTFREARDLLLQFRDDYHGARAAFVWPRPERFNWALDWFDAELAAGEGGGKPALKVISVRASRFEASPISAGNRLGSQMGCARSAPSAATGY